MSTLALPAAATDDVLRAATRLSRAVVLAGLALTPVLWLLPSSASSVVALVVVGAGLLAGLPHGSVDHRVAAGLSGRPAAVVALTYAATAALAWAAMHVVGAAAVVVVVAVSVAHFALGELEVVRETTGWRPSAPVALAVAVAGTGALLLPLARAGEVLGRVATAISPRMGQLLDLAPVRLGLVGLWALGAVVAVVAAARARQSSVVVDVVLIGALGLLAPPLVAFAIWFGGWHGLRHCARLLGVEPRCADLVAAGKRGAAVRRLAGLAAWPTAAATATLVVLVALTLAAPDATAAVGATLVVLLALTVPHMVVVGWLDLRARHGPALADG